MNSLAIAHLVLMMKPKQIFCNDYSRIEWMLQKAAELGYAACMSEFVNFSDKKSWK